MTAGHVVFRADASPTVGIGHVIRCRTLAEALVVRGWTATMATPDGNGLATGLTGAGLRIVALEPGSSPTDEADAIATAIGGRITLVVADQYNLGAAWFEAMRDRSEILMAIDDLADRKQPVHLLLNQNLGATPAQYVDLVPAAARVLAGPEYALVRPEFAQRRARGRVRTGRVDRILIFLSGADQANVTDRAVEALANVDVSVDVVVGAAYPHLAELRARVAHHPGAEVHVNIETMAELMDRADLAIGAPSSASWERCTLGLPAVLVALADNQLLNERRLVVAGAAVTAGWHTTVTPSVIRDIVVSLRADPARVVDMSRAAADITDGRGTDRVVAEIEKLAAATSETG